MHIRTNIDYTNSILCSAKCKENIYDKEKGKNTQP